MNDSTIGTTWSLYRSVGEGMDQWMEGWMDEWLDGQMNLRNKSLLQKHKLNKIHII
jgi:hypothetical protein